MSSTHDDHLELDETATVIPIVLAEGLNSSICDFFRTQISAGAKILLILDGTKFRQEKMIETLESKSLEEHNLKNDPRYSYSIQPLIQWNSVVVAKELASKHNELTLKVHKLSVEFLVEAIKCKLKHIGLDEIRVTTEINDNIDAIMLGVPDSLKDQHQQYANDLVTNLQLKRRDNHDHLEKMHIILSKQPSATDSTTFIPTLKTYTTPTSYVNPNKRELSKDNFLSPEKRKNAKNEKNNSTIKATILQQPLIQPFALDNIKNSNRSPTPLAIPAITAKVASRRVLAIKGNTSGDRRHSYQGKSTNKSANNQNSSLLHASYQQQNSQLSHQFQDQLSYQQSQPRIQYTYNSDSYNNNHNYNNNNNNNNDSYNNNSNSHNNNNSYNNNSYNNNNSINNNYDKNYNYNHHHQAPLVQNHFSGAVTHHPMSEPHYKSRRQS